MESIHGFDSLKSGGDGGEIIKERKQKEENLHKLSYMWGVIWSLYDGIDLDNDTY